MNMFQTQCLAIGGCGKNGVAVVPHVVMRTPSYQNQEIDLVLNRCTEEQQQFARLDKTKQIAMGSALPLLAQKVRETVATGTISRSIDQYSFIPHRGELGLMDPVVPVFVFLWQ